MHPNPIWRMFLLFMTIVVLSFTGATLYKIYGYVRLNATTETTAISWSVYEESDERYFLQAHYTFLAQDGLSYTGESLVAPAHRNAWAAEQAIPRATEKPWTVWYSARNPHHSRLDKSFPLKETISAVLLWGVAIYFITTSIRVSKIFQKRHSRIDRHCREVYTEIPHG